MTQSTPPQGPVLFEIAAEPLPDVGAAPDIDEGTAMHTAVARMARPPSRWAALVWSALGGLVSIMVGVAAWDFVMGMLARWPVLGWTAAVLSGVLLAALAVWLLREVWAYRRLRRLDTLRRQADAALQSASLSQAQAVATALASHYGARTSVSDALDAEAVLEHAEIAFLVAADTRATTEIEAAARQVATATALVPLAFADVAVALAANMRMIRRIAEIYGGRPGMFGNWRLTRAVAVHLMATGMVAVGDDLVGSLAGGGLVSKLSRRFGEGVVNGALTVRVGLAAMDVCRPLPFRIGKRPGVTALTSRALAGLFSRS